MILAGIPQFVSFCWNVSRVGPSSDDCNLVVLMKVEGAHHVVHKGVPIK